MNEQTTFEMKFRDADDIKIIDISGYLDAYTANDLEQAIFQIIQNQQFKIIVNFSALEYISSAGLGVFMAFIEEVREKDGDIKLAGMSQKVYSVFDLLGFPMLFEIEENEHILIEKFKSNFKNTDE